MFLNFSKLAKIKFINLSYFKLAKIESMLFEIFLSSHKNQILVF
eukprot:UN21989